MLKLPLFFYVDCGEELSKELKLHGPSSTLWIGKYVSKRRSIEGLTGLMKCYGIKPYHIVVMKYNGGYQFRLEVYNSYAVKITYPPDRHESTLDLFCNSTKLDKLCCNFMFNAFRNFKEFINCLFIQIICWVAYSPRYPF